MGLEFNLQFPKLQGTQISSNQVQIKIRKYIKSIKVETGSWYIGSDVTGSDVTGSQGWPQRSKKYIK